MFTINSHPQVHPEPVHTNTREPGSSEGGGASKTAPVSVTSPATAGFASTPRTTGMAATFVSPDHPARVTLPGDSTTYYVKDTSKTGVPQTLYTRDPQTGVLKQTSKQALSDGGGGWKAVGGLKGGVDPSKEVRAHRIHLAKNRLREARAWVGDAEREFRAADEDAVAGTSEYDEADASFNSAREVVTAARDRVTRARQSLRHENLSTEERLNGENNLADLEAEHADAEAQYDSARDRLRHAGERLETALERFVEADASFRTATERLGDAMIELSDAQNSSA